MGKFLLGWKLSWKLQARNQDFFGAGQVSWNRHFDKHFMHDIQKKASGGKKFLVFFSKIFLKLHFKREFNP